MIVTKEFQSRLMSLKLAGKKPQYTQAWMILGELESGETVSKNFRSDTRIPNCRKYELPDGYRIVFQAVEGVENEYLALFVGSHEEVDHFLDHHRGWIFDPQRHTLKELRFNTAESELLNSVRSPELQAVAAPVPIRRAILADLGDERLRNAGLTDQEISKAKTLEDPDSMETLAFLGELENSTNEILLSYMTGSADQRAEIEALLSKERQLVTDVTAEQLPALTTCTDEFVSLTNIPEEKRAFEEMAFESWMLYLHPDQKALTTRDFNGAARLRGVSGSGKTVVAIHRARYAAQQLVQSKSTGKVLFLTFNRSLKDLVDRLLRRLCTADEYERIEVSTVGKWAVEFIKFRTGAAPAWNDRTVDSIWQSVLTKHLAELQHANVCSSNADANNNRDSDIQFIADEIDFVYGKFLHRDANQYLKVDRIGRGRRLGPHQRAAILRLYSDFVAEVAKVKQYDSRELARIACALIEKGESPRENYSEVIVDEIQDLSQIELRIVKVLGEICGRLFLVGDGAQQIYRRGQSLKSIGINVSGRSFILHKNYRNTAEIVAAASTLRSAEGIGRFDEDPDASQADAIPSAVSGERPAVMICPTPDKELDLVVREITYLTARLGFNPSQICCMSRVGYIRDHLLEALSNAGIKALHYRADGVGTDDAVLVSTLHNAKGHEFRAVFILGVYEGALPLITAIDDEEVEREAALLYVAMTRAKELLYLSYSTTDTKGGIQQRSRFLDDMWKTVEVLDFTAAASAVAK